MKNLLVVFLLLLPVYLISQCDVAQDIPLDGALIYPLPFGVFPEEEGGLGINTDATIGEAYEFVWTIVLPDTFINNITFQETYGDSLVFFADSMSYVFNGERIEGLPDGFMIEFSEENGSFKALTGQASGCIKLSGTPSTDLVPGDYIITFRSANCVRIPGTFDGCQYADIPSAFSGFPGEYRLTILEDTTSPVLDINHTTLEITPTLTNDFISIQLDDSFSGTTRLTIHDSQGILVHQEMISSSNEVRRRSLSHLQNGLYFVTAENGNTIGTQKIFVVH